jgi:signal transduction histidine kinase
VGTEGRARRVPLGAELALAFLAGATWFALVAVVVAATDSNVLVAVVGVLCAAAVVAIARLWGVAYAAPAALATLLAYDWFEFPPTHPHEFPASGDLADLFAYLTVAVLIGELAAYAGRRADVSEVARSKLADEQAALRRVATLVARGASPDEASAAAADEVGALLDVDGASVVRYEGDEEVTQLAGWSAPGYDPPPPGRAKLGTRSGIRAPIVVDERIWGAMLAWLERPEPLPDEAEARLAGFAGLVATAISNTARREELARLAAEQAALRRVATLVARAVPPSEVFAAVTEEVGTLLCADLAGMIRYETDDAVSVVATWAAVGEHPAVPERWPTEEGDPAMLVANARRPVRIDDWAAVPGPIAAFIRDEAGISSSVGSPIVVDGLLWGALAVHSKRAGRLAADTESRLENFTELVATAMSNVQARAEVGRLADEQAALRRVATLVARESSPAEVFAAVTEEVGRLLHVEDTKMIRYEPDGTATVMASWGELDATIAVGTSWGLEGDNVSARVQRTGRAARIDDYANAAGPLAVFLRNLGIRSSVATPIVVGGRLWGAMIATSRQTAALPADAEARVGEFTELVATAIANIEARSELAASRARIVAAADDERRRLVRDLHDGAQQRLVYTVVTLKLADQALKDAAETAPALVSEALQQAEDATAELRELAHGILPGVLTRGGLRASVDALASRMPVPVENDVSVGRLPSAVEATAYFVVAEALTNVAKHARADHAAVTARVEDGMLRVDVRDDGVGGARPGGSGLVGLADRLAALDGRLRVENAAGGGTLVEAAIPLSA